jgi:Family of unknown function (DUF6932)
MSMATLHDLTVSAFSQTSITRPQIWSGLEGIVRRLIGLKIEGNVWVDGSFLTRKIDPKDGDIVLVIKASFFQSATQEQKDVMLWVAQNLRGGHRCDTFLFQEYDPPDPLAAESEFERAYWMRQYGMSRGLDYKGIAVIDLRSP